MFKCRGFKASFDFITGKQRRLECDISPVSINGAYRTNKDEYNDNDFTYNPPKKLVPSMVKLPKSQNNEYVKPSKSTSDLVKTTDSKENLTRSSHDISLRYNEFTKQTRVEKQDLMKTEQKRQEIAAKQKHRQEKQAVEKVKQERSLKKEKQERTEKKSRLKKNNAPSPPQSSLYNRENPSKIQTKHQNQPPHNNQTIPNVSQTIRQYSTNTLESSISRSSGPPPYGEYPEIFNEMHTDNITYGKPVNSSWDLISQHREQMKPIASAQVAPRRRKDMQYSVGNLRMDNDNSEA